MVLFGDSNVKGLEGPFDLLLDAAGENLAAVVVLPEMLLRVVNADDGVVALGAVIVDANGDDAFGESGCVASIATICFEDPLSSCHVFLLRFVEITHKFTL